MLQKQPISKSDQALAPVEPLPRKALALIYEDALPGPGFDSTATEALNAEKLAEPNLDETWVIRSEMGVMCEPMS